MTRKDKLTKILEQSRLSPLAKIQNFSILMTDSFIIEVIDMVKVIVKSIAIDSLTGSPIVLLANEENQNDVYPIWIGIAEAEGIVVNQSGFIPPRPLTYDLFKNVIEAIDGKVKEVRIIDMVNNAYIANIVIQQGDREIIIDSRPSDAINLALRFNSPIYLNEQVVKKLNLEELKSQEKDEEIQTVEDLERQTEAPKLDLEKTEEIGIKDEDLEKFREMIENIKPEDFLTK